MVPMQADRAQRLAQLARARHDQTLQRARDALAAMAVEGECVTVAGLAAKARVSRSWLYTQPELRDQIEQLRNSRNAGSPTTASTSSRASAESLRHRLELAHQQIARLRTENRQLSESLARAHGQLRAEKLTS